jgi:hypothetical protein
MENYIVRIYRRDPNDPRNVLGILESVELETRQSFSTIGALQSLLVPCATPDAQGVLHPNTDPKVPLPRRSHAK